MDEALIAAVECRRALFDKTTNEYSNRTFIQKQWEEIGTELGEDAETVRKRWARLRDYFQRSHKNIKSFKSGSAGAKKRKWYLYDAMSFLVPFLADRPTTISCSMSEDNEEADPVESPSMPPSPSSGTFDDIDVVQNRQKRHISGERQQKQRRKWAPTVPAFQGRKRKLSKERVSNASLLDMEIMKTMMDLGEGVAKSIKQERVQDDDEMYCLSLVPKMRELDAITKLECQAEMNSVLVKHLKAMQVKNVRAFSPTPVVTQLPLRSLLSASSRDATQSSIGPSASSPPE